MIIVVEGKHDATVISSIYPNSQILITNGSEVNDGLINELKELVKTNEIYVCVDPDGPGNKIRDKLNSNISGLINVYAEKEKAISKNKKKVGIEHMKKEDIISLFNNAKFYNKTNNISYMQIYKLGLADSKVSRAKLCLKLNIGYCNAKQLVKRLNMHGYSIEEVEKYI